MRNFPQTLRHLVTIQERGPAQDAAGQPQAAAWVDWPPKVWADIRFTGGLETIKAGAVTATAQASIRMRQRAGLNAGMRVLYEGVTYEVRAVLPDMKNRAFVDLVTEVVDAQI